MSRRNLAVVVVVAIALSNVSGRVEGQGVTSLPNELACGDCYVEVVPVITLGDTTPTAEGLIPPSVSGVARTSGGWIVLSYSGFLPIWFDDSGVYRGVIGRIGGGPGEFRRPRLLSTGPRDSVTVYDLGTNAVTVLSPNFAFRRRTALKAIALLPMTFVTLSDGSLVFNGQIRTERLAGYPLHLVSVDGELQAQIGETMAYDPNASNQSRRVLAEAADGELWSGHVTRYVIDHFTHTGRSLGSLRRDVDWFPAWTSWEAPTPDRKPMPLPVGMWDDEGSGYLWYVVNVPGTKWRDALGRRRPDAHGNREYQIIDDHVLYDTMVEVIDYRRGVVVASDRMSGQWRYIVGSGLVGRVVSRSGGADQVEVVRLTLRQ